MAKHAAITVRLPVDLKQRLSRRARREKRSLSAQVEYELVRALAEEATEGNRARKPSAGRYAGTPVPTDADFAEVRALLWGRLGRRNG